MTDRGRPRRVAMVIQAFAPVLGGAQRQVEQLGPRLERRGVDVTVVTRRPAGTPRRERRPGLAVHRVRTPALPGAASVAYTVGGTGRALAARPDVVHAHDLLSPTTIGLLAAAGRRAPLVVKPLSAGPHGDVARLHTKPAGAARMGALVRRAAAFVCVSDEVEAELLAHGARREQLVRIPNGVDCERFHPGPDGTLRERLGVGDDPLWLYCGRLTAEKRLERLVAALRDAPGHLLLAGEGPREDALRAAARAAGVGERLHLLATVDDTAPLYRAADAYVTASDQDGLSNAVLEAMASGLPVVAAPAGGMRELVRPDTGVLAGDAAQIAAALERLAADPAARLALGAAARARVERELSIERTADRLAELYAAVAA